MRRALHLGSSLSRSFAKLVAHRALDAAIAVIAAEERARQQAHRVALAIRGSRRSADPVDPARPSVIRRTVRSELRSRAPLALEVRREAPVAVAPLDLALDLALLDVEGLLAEVRADLGCRGPGTRSHRACRAIDLLSAFPLERATIASLEETVSAPRRPVCVQRGAIDALANDRSDLAQRALARMQNTARVRAEWSADRDVAELATRIGAARTHAL